MATNTPNLNLVKPATSDKMKDTITALASNMDTLDSHIHNNDNQIGIWSGSMGTSVESFQIQTPEVDDTGRIQRAANSLTNGGTLIFNPYKTYNIGSTINNIDNITFIGYETKINATSSITLFNAGNNNHFEGITFQNCDTAVNANGKNNVNFFRCKFINMATVGIYYYGANSSYVHKCYFTGITKSSIIIDNNGYDIEITGNRFVNTQEFGGYASGQTSAHVNVLSGDDIRVIGNLVKNNGGQGIIFGYNSTLGSGATNCQAIGNKCVGNGQEGITCFGGSSKLSSDHIVTGNISRKNRYHQIEVWQADRCNVIGNEVDENNTYGNIGAIMLYNSIHSKAVGNTVRNASNNGIAITTGSDKCLISKNNIFNTNGLNLTGTPQGHGILLDSNGGAQPTNISILDNTIESTNGNTSTNKAGIYSTSNVNQGNQIDYIRGFGYQWPVHSYAYSTCYNRGTAAPTTGGPYLPGEFVKNTNPTQQGTAGSMYVIEGWICVAAGSPGAWQACHVLTGN